MESLFLKIPDNDREIIEEIRRGNKKVFEAVYKMNYKKLFRIACSYTGSAQSAEEIVHDVFLNVWNKSEKLEITQSLNNYLSRAVVNRSISEIRREKRKAESLAPYESQEVENLASENEADHQELILQKLEQVLETLPPQCKKVMMMSRFQKLQQKDIAAQLNISVKTVKNHLTYGFKKLREQLAEQYIENEHLTNYGRF
ncbi:RNA polymerase sigma-70 factor [Pedobacter sp. HMF7647]|uniref:RNA polymerase sigma-70 factor n=1 Tax=Hufsiella arboris TaxID=2695275 RepID=A0A7K1YAH5_9SPHI|nr:RNA polymerase sigma-70 factor [Hufsiella arboris]MXV51586.1 RNA polymerase sigma-70 factor [Hufsiella arboris]